MHKRQNLNKKCLAFNPINENPSLIERKKPLWIARRQYASCDTAGAVIESTKNQEKKTVMFISVACSIRLKQIFLTHIPGFCNYVLRFNRCETFADLISSRMNFSISNQYNETDTSLSVFSVRAPTKWHAIIGTQRNQITLENTILLLLFFAVVRCVFVFWCFSSYFVRSVWLIP